MYKVTEEELFDIEMIFKMMGDTTRLRIFLALFENPHTVSALAERLEMSQSAVSHQLSALRRVKLVEAERDGVSMIYRLKDDHVRTIFVQGLEHVREED